MYKMIIDMLDDDMDPREIAAKLDIPVRQVRAIEDDYYQFV